MYMYISGVLLAPHPVMISTLQNSGPNEMLSRVICMHTFYVRMIDLYIVCIQPHHLSLVWRNGVLDTLDSPIQGAVTVGATSPHVRYHLK